MMDFDAFIQAGWTDHADQPREVADRLAASLHRVERAEQIPPFVGLLTHVYGEHLGLWQQGAILAGRLPDFPGHELSTRAVARACAALRYAGGDTTAMGQLTPEDEVWALGTATSALGGQQAYTAAISAYHRATAMADGLPSGSPAFRSLAVAGNNLASSLEEKSPRSDEEAAGMVAAARGGLKYWKLAGTWLEEERAEYRLARSLLQAGEYVEAVKSAGRCVVLCQQHQAPAFEKFFGYTVLAMAHRAVGDRDAFVVAREHARGYFDQLEVEDKPWCEAELKSLAGE